MSLKDKLEEYLMNAAHTGSMMQGGKTLNPGMFSKEAKELLQAFIQELERIEKQAIFIACLDTDEDHNVIPLEAITKAKEDING